MKRTEMIILGAAGVLLVASLWPSSEPKEESTQGLAFASPDECRAAGALPAAECQTEFDRAREQSLAVAPKFESQQSCEQEYGASNCRSATWNGASVFLPAMAGFLLARSLGGGQQTLAQPLFPNTRQGQVCPPGVDPRLRPDCAQPRASSGGGGGYRSFSTGSGRTVVPGGISGPPGSVALARGAAVAQPVRSTVVSRGGFGSISRAFSSSGS